MIQQKSLLRFFQKTVLTFFQKSFRISSKYPSGIIILFPLIYFFNAIRISSLDLPGTFSHIPLGLFRFIWHCLGDPSETKLKIIFCFTVFKFFCWQFLWDSFVNFSRNPYGILPEIQLKFFQVSLGDLVGFFMEIPQDFFGHFSEILPIIHLKKFENPPGFFPSSVLTEFLL